jgi:hypothetical protein
MRIQPMALIRATNGLSLVLNFARAGSTNTRGYCGYPWAAQQNKNTTRHTMHSACASCAALVASDDLFGKGLAAY